MSKTFDTLGNDTVGVVFDNLVFKDYGNCRERSSSPFRDYADRDLGSSRFLRIRCLLSRTGSWTSREFPIYRVLGIMWVNLADFFGFSWQEEHPSEAANETRV